MTCREVALSVAASVALSAAENMVATSSELVGSLPNNKDAGDPEAAAKAESLIVKSRYEPLVN